MWLLEGRNVDLLAAVDEVEAVSHVTFVWLAVLDDAGVGVNRAERLVMVVSARPGKRTLPALVDSVLGKSNVG